MSFCKGNQQVNYTGQYLMHGTAKSHCQGSIHFSRLQNLIKGAQKGFEYDIQLVYTNLWGQFLTVG